MKNNENIEIDSFKFRISLNLVQLNPDSELCDKYSLINETNGELTPMPSRVPRLILKKTGYNYEYYIQNFKSQRYLYIKINAKMLETRYLEGITLDNIHIIYNEIIKQKIVSFTYEHFLTHSFITDIDFKRDFRCEKVEYLKYLKHLRIMTPERKDSYGYDTYKGGLNWNARRTTKPVSHPNLKIYDKEKELNGKSMDITDTYLQQQDLTDLKRLEFTLKNTLHMKSLGILNTNLKTLLSLTQEEKEVILEKITGKCINTDLTVIDEQPDESELTPAQLFMLSNLKIAVKVANSMQETIDIMTLGQTTSNKHKYAKKIADLYERFIYKTHDDKEEIRNNFNLWSLILRLETIQKKKGLSPQPENKDKKVDTLTRILNDYNSKLKTA